MSLTQATKAGLDAARRAMGQGRMVLTMLKHKTGDDPRGYEPVVEVKAGWLITEPRKAEAVELYIVTGKGVTEQNLLDARAFGIRQKGAAVGSGKIYKFKGDAKQRPLGTGLELFVWEIRPTTETF